MQTSPPGIFFGGGREAFGVRLRPKLSPSSLSGVLVRPKLSHAIPFLCTSAIFFQGVGGKFSHFYFYS